MAHGGPLCKQPQYVVPHESVYVVDRPGRDGPIGWDVVEKARAGFGLKSLTDEGRDPAYIQAAADLGVGIADPKKITLPRHHAVISRLSGACATPSEPASRRSTRTAPGGSKPPAPAGDACIIVIYGPELGKRLQLGTAPFEIGRSSKNDLFLDQESISRHHARITFDGTATGSPT